MMVELTTRDSDILFTPTTLIYTAVHPFDH